MALPLTQPDLKKFFKMFPNLGPVLFGPVQSDLGKLRVQGCPAGLKYEWALTLVHSISHVNYCRCKIDISKIACVCVSVGSALRKMKGKKKKSKNGSGSDFFGSGKQNNNIKGVLQPYGKSFRPKFQ